MSRCILCVDDERVILDALKSQLSKVYENNFEIEIAQSADEALEVLEELQEDGCEVLVIVSDWLMPGMKGDEFLIQAHKKMPCVVKILLSGQADACAVENAKEHANLLKLIHKPWSTKELVESINVGLKLNEK